MTEKVIVGQEPTEEDEFYAAAVGSLTPDKSLERITDIAKFLIGSSSVVGAILTGFGAISVAGYREYPWPLGIVIIITAVSLFLAALGLVLHPGRLNTSDISQLKSWFTTLLFWRGQAVRASGFGFALALLVAAVAGFASLAQPDPRPSVSLHVAGAGSDAKLQVHVGIQNLKAGSSIHTIVLARQTPAGAGTVLLDDMSMAGPGGAADITVDLPAIDGYRTFETDVTMVSNGRTTKDRILLPRTAATRSSYAGRT